MPRRPSIHLFLFGAPRLEAAGRPADLDTRKALALCAYVAVQGGAHQREKLAALFWPDSDAVKAHAALRRTLSALNTALAGAGLVIERETVAPAPDLWVDVAEFRRLAGEDDPAALARAVDLYRDDFLAGFSLRDSAPFDDWQFFQAEALKREAAGVLEKLVRAHTAAGDFTRALTFARRWAGLDALHEPVHRELMQLYAWTGQRAAALRQYQECARILQAELGVPPLEETARLAEAIRAHRLPLPAQTTSSQPPIFPAVEPPPSAIGRQPPLLHLPLVGRSTEWEQLSAAHAAARTSGQWLVLEGEAGLGKTRLAEEFLAHVQASGSRPPLVARCYAGQAGLAYGPLIESLRQALARPDAAARLAALPEHHRLEAARLLPELGAAGPPPAGPGAQSRFFEGVRQALLALSAGPEPGVLCVDDLQWADEATAELLAYLVRRLGTASLFLIATWRGEDVPPQHRLRLLLAEAQRAGAGRLLALRRLNMAEVRELAAAVLPAAVLTPATLDRLQRETEGAPLFLVEYLAALSGQAGADQSWELPAGVRALLAARLAQATETGRQALAAAAVIGRAFDAELLQAVAGRSEEETVQALDELLARGLIVETAAAAYAFSHDKLRALTYDQLSLARRGLLHRRAADALVARLRLAPEAGRAAPPPAAEIARHYQLGGRPETAAEHFRRAGDHARLVFANADALAYYRAALSLGYRPAAEAHEAVGDLLTLAGDYAAARASYETASAGRPEALARLEQKLAELHDRSGEWDLADAHFRAAAALSEAGPASARARLYADWSRSAHHAGHTAEAEALAGQALALAEAADDLQALARAHNVLGLLAGRRADFAQAAAHLTHSLELSERLGDPDARIAALNNLALVRREAGDLAGAIALSERALAQCAALGDRHHEAALLNNLADLHHAAGQTEAAMRYLKQAVARFAGLGDGEGARQPGLWKLTEW